MSELQGNRLGRKCTERGFRLHQDGGRIGRAAAGFLEGRDVGQLRRSRSRDGIGTRCREGEGGIERHQFAIRRRTNAHPYRIGSAAGRCYGKTDLVTLIPKDGIGIAGFGTELGFRVKRCRGPGCCERYPGLDHRYGRVFRKNFLLAGGRQQARYCKCKNHFFKHN